MSPELQRIAIADAWLEMLAGLGTSGSATSDGYLMVKGSGSHEDPLTDLNVMHAVENTLFGMEVPTNGGWRTRYLDNLLKICAGGFHAGIHATASQRAEAFLKTVGKWQEGDK